VRRRGLLQRLQGLLQRLKGLLHAPASQRVEQRPPAAGLPLWRRRRSPLRRGGGRLVRGGGRQRVAHPRPCAGQDRRRGAHEAAHKAAHKAPRPTLPPAVAAGGRRRRRGRGRRAPRARRRRLEGAHLGARDETCPVSTWRGMRRVQLVREGSSPVRAVPRAGARTRAAPPAPARSFTRCVAGAGDVGPLFQKTTFPKTLSPRRGREGAGALEDAACPISTG
jgi:hypothetical protein